MNLKNVAGAIVASTILATATPSIAQTSKTSQTTTQTKTAINNCLATEPLIKKMYDEIIMTKESYRKQKEGRIDELCNIMAAARRTYTKQKLDILIQSGIKDLEPTRGIREEAIFTALLAILDKNGTTEAGRGAKGMLKTNASVKAYYDEYLKCADGIILIDDIIERLKKAEGK